MSEMSRTLSYLLAANIQAVTLFIFAYWVGEELDVKYERDFSWQLVTIPVALLVSIQIFYMVIRQTFLLDKKRQEQKERAADDK